MKGAVPPDDPRVALAHEELTMDASASDEPRESFARRGAPRVSISRSSWIVLQAELDRVYPAEGLALPLVALVPRDPSRNPCAPIALDAIAEVVIARVVLVPRDRQVNHLFRVGVIAMTDPVVEEQVQAQLRRHPRLRACAYLHSHPFARGQTRPSAGPGCDIDGHMRPLLEHNRRSGLEASFSFIACPAASGAGWVLHGFALDGRGQLVELGTASLLDDEQRLQELLLPPLHGRTPVRALLRRWRRELRRQGLSPRSDELFDGWLRTILPLGRGWTLVVLWPLGFPASPARPFLLRPDGASVELRPPGTLSPQRWALFVEEIHKRETAVTPRRDDATLARTVIVRDDEGRTAVTPRCDDATP